MSSHAGGFGRLTFPSTSALESWKAARVAHADHDDWPDDLVTRATAPFVVARELARLGKLGPGSGVLEVAVGERDVTLIMDVEEEAFNDHAGRIAALLRAGAEHGADGSFVFLGTAGAEEDFSVELTLAKKKSRATALEGPRVRAAYRSDAYRRFQQDVSDRLARDNPLYRKALAGADDVASRPETKAQNGGAASSAATTAAAPTRSNAKAQSAPSPAGKAKPAEAQATGAKAKPAEAQATGAKAKPAKASAPEEGDPFAPFLAAKDTEACNAALQALAKRPLPELARGLDAALDKAATRKPETTLTVASLCDQILVDLARRLDARKSAPRLAALARSKRGIELRNACADLLLDWGLELKALSSFVEPAPFGIQPQVAVAKLVLAPDKAIKALLPITPKNESTVFHLLQGLDADKGRAKKRKAVPLLQQHRGLAALVDAARSSGDEALAALAKSLGRVR